MGSKRGLTGSNEGELKKWQVDGENVSGKRNKIFETEENEGK